MRLTWAFVLLVGVASLIGALPASKSAGLLCALTGLVGCAWEAGKWVRHWQSRRQARRQAVLRAEAQAAQKQVRQLRKTEQRAQQQEEKSAQARIREQQQRQQSEARQTRVEQASAEEARRRERFERIASEAQRLQSLDTATFHAEAEHIFSLRGLLAQLMQEQGMPFLLLSPFMDTHKEIACFVDSVVPAAVADVEALEQARLEAGAVHAYLVSRNSFTPAAIRLAQRFPLTFVEPQLLAQWKYSAESK